MLVPMIVGGILFGFGFFFGGFCPGTAVVSAVRGRLDGLVFLIGVTLGIFGFALFIDGPGQAAWFQSFYLPTSARVMRMYGAIPSWVVVIIIAIGVITSFRFLYILEQRYSLKTVEELASGATRPRPVAPALTMFAKAGLVGVAAVLVALALVHPTTEPEIVVAAETERAVGIDDSITIDALSVVGWMVSDGARVDAGTPVNSFVLDMRSARSRTAAPMKSTAEIALPGHTVDEVVDLSLEALADLTEADRNKPVVVVADTGITGITDVVAGLRAEGIRAVELEGGSDAWYEAVFAEGVEWPSVGLDAEAMANYRTRVARWMSGKVFWTPPYIPIPGTEQLPAKVATAVATGGGGGGCG